MRNNGTSKYEPENVSRLATKNTEKRFSSFIRKNQIKVKRRKFTVWFQLQGTGRKGKSQEKSYMELWKKI